MKILFLNASPREKGYTSQVLRLIEERIAPAHNLDWIKVNSLSIAPCQGCLKCRPNKACVLPDDDGQRIAGLIRQADALVVGSPTYFGNITGPLRTLTDRCLTAFEEIAASGLEQPVPLHSGKKAAIVTACNMPAPMSRLPNQGAGAISAMETMVKAGGYDLVGAVLVDGAAALKEIPREIVKQAEAIADALTAP